MVRGNRLDELDVMLAEGEIAAARRQDAQAEYELSHRPRRSGEPDLDAPRSGASIGEALRDAREHSRSGERLSDSADDFRDGARGPEERNSKLPFLANATPIYDDYIHFLVKQGRADEALAAADQSRARTLAQGLGLETGKSSLKPAALRAADVARKSGSTILFYWLGSQQSYLWAITAKKTAVFPLPGQGSIAPLIDRYRKALLQPALGREAASADGMALYRMLVGPAAQLCSPMRNVVVVCDGPLSLLNFETLIVPGSGSIGAPHYWIEDANVVSAPSLYMLAAAKRSVAGNKKLLMMGDAISPNPDYPRLPMARAEMEKIAQHFAPADETVFARQAANSDAYLKSSLRDYAYIHFVAHGVASRTDPLDSAIILSRTGAAEDSFKLHAREIIQHPIDARLVTISAVLRRGDALLRGRGAGGAIVGLPAGRRA